MSQNMKMMCQTMPWPSSHQICKTYSNNKIEGGECSTPGIIALKSIYLNKVLKNKIKLNNKSKVLIFGCEGATDIKMYKKLIKLK